MHRVTLNSTELATQAGGAAPALAQRVMDLLGKQNLPAAADPPQLHLWHFQHGSF